MKRILKPLFWVNGIKSLVDNNGNARMSATARQYLSESNMNIDELVEWCKENRNHPSAYGFDTQSFINELEYLQAKKRQ